MKSVSGLRILVLYPMLVLLATSSSASDQDLIQGRTINGLLSTPPVAPVAAPARGCPPGEVLIAEDANNFYCLSEEEYNKSKGPELAAKYCSAKVKVAADQNAIRNLGFAADVERNLAMSKLAEQQQATLRRKVMLSMFDQSLSAVGKLADSAKSLNPWNVNKAVKLLEDKGFANAQLVRALRKVAGVRGKPQMASAYHDFERLAKSFIEGYNTNEGATKDPDSAELQLLLGALKVAQGNYELGVLVTSLEFAESIGYLAYISGEVDDLASATDDKLMRLGSYGKRLKDEVGELVRVRDAWTAETEIPIAPICGQ